MQGGDIAAGVSERMLVHLDLVRSIVEQKSKVMGLIPVTKKQAVFDPVMLNKLWRFTSRTNLLLEVFTDSDVDIDAVMEELDRLAVNPFRYASKYATIPELVGSLPYRPGIIGVIDLPHRQLFYGHWYFDLSRV
jgi:hypothetical protein